MLSLASYYMIMAAAGHLRRRARTEDVHLQGSSLFLYFL